MFYENTALQKASFLSFFCPKKLYCPPPLFPIVSEWIVFIGLGAVFLNLLCSVHYFSGLCDQMIWKQRSKGYLTADLTQLEYVFYIICSCTVHNKNIRFLNTVSGSGPK
jgi:hypothetical protein